MQKYSIEFIMLRQLADYLSLSIFIFDVRGILIFYNQAAEEIIGLKFSEQGEISIDEWRSFFVENKKSRYDVKEKILPFDLASYRPIYQKKILFVKSKKNKMLYMVLSFPIITQANKILGSAAFFQKV